MKFQLVVWGLAALFFAFPAASEAAVPQDGAAASAQSPPPDTQTPAPHPLALQPESGQQLPPAQPSIHFERAEPLKSISNMGTTFLPLDSWIYPAMIRLYGMGFVDTEFLGLRPWTRLSVLQMLEQSAPAITGSNNDEAIEIYAAIENSLASDQRVPLDRRYGAMTLESIYGRAYGITGTPLRDSFHLGQTDINDFGRYYASGFNTYDGFSARGHYGPFSLYFRGELQHAPGWPGYNLSLAETLAKIDDFATFSSVPLAGNTTIPLGPVPAVSNPTILEGYVSANVLGNQVSLGKMDHWFGTAVGGGMAWSNNAENVYCFCIDRVAPLYIPFISRVAGLIRYDFLVGPLKGHNDPVSPWVHAEKISFKPTDDLEFGFERTVIWGGIGHEPVTLGTFWRSFYSISDTNSAEKFSRNDPGARFSEVDFAWRLPFLTHWLTLYSDSDVHDDVFAITAPRRGAYRPGIYLSHFPGAPKLDFRVEAADTAPSTGPDTGGQFMYTEVVQRNGYTNNGQLMGDWVGREDKGGQAWLTYHLSPKEWMQLNYRRDKATADFIPGGTTQNIFGVEVVKRLQPQLELRAFFQYEHYKIPIYKPAPQNDAGTSFQLTWYPAKEKTF